MEPLYFMCAVFIIDFMSNKEFKICFRCKRKLNLDEFGKSPKRYDGLQTFCRPCQSEYQKEWYRANKKEHLRRSKARNKEVRSELKRRLGEYLSKHPCVDCGEQDVVVLDFDHIKGNKVLGISQMVRSYYSWPRILCEINKCDVRCSNCHRKKTAKQFGWYTNKLIGSSG